MKPYGAELRFRGADDGNRTRVFSLGSRFKASRSVRGDVLESSRLVTSS